MRKHRLYRRAVKRGQAIAFAADDPNAPANRPRHHHERLEKNLGRCRDLLQSKRVAEGLQKLNALAAAATSPKRQAQILALAGDAEFRQGHFDSAINAYRSASQLVVNDPRAWLRPGIAEVRALLKAARVDEAYAAATVIWNRSFAQHEETQRHFAIQQAHIQHRKILIKQRPYRASVVASRLGYLFLNEGEHTQAKDFFTKAVTVNPQGGSRARHGLSIIALAENNFAEAESRAREALLLGKFQGKTIGVWETLIAARQRAGKTGIDADLLAGVQSSKSSTVRARAILSLCRALRERDDPAWKPIATNWLNSEGATHSIVATELRKLENAENRLAGGDATLMATPERLSRSEYIFAAKQLTRTSLLEGQSVDIGALVATASRLFGPSCKNRISHGLALSCIKANRHDMARPLLRAVIAENRRNTVGVKALWALARMESQLENHSQAAALFALLADEPRIPVQFRLQARLLWLKSAVAAGDNLALEDIRDDLIAATNQIEDFDLLLDFAKRLLDQPEEFHALADDLVARGQALAVQKLGSAQHPSEAAGILFRLARHQLCYFHKYQDAISVWRGLTTQQRLWLWSEKGDFWRYLRLVLQAHERERQFGEVEQLAQSYIFATATPAEGFATLGSSYASYKMFNSQPNAALELFGEIVRRAPLHRYSSIAYYWLGLQAWKVGNSSQSKSLMGQIVKCLSKETQIVWELKLIAADICIQTDLNAMAPSDVQSHVTSTMLVNAREDIDAHLSLL